MIDVVNLLFGNEQTPSTDNPSLLQMWDISVC